MRSNDRTWLENEQEKEVVLIDGVYPNPFTDFIAIKVQDEWRKQETSVSIYDALGNVLWSNTYLFGSTDYLHINEGVPSWASGYYFVQIKGEDFLSNVKLIKQ